MKIRTEHDRTPFGEWSAIDVDSYDGAPDSDSRTEIGYGETELAAVIDLMEQMQDRWYGYMDRADAEIKRLRDLLANADILAKHTRNDSRREWVNAGAWLLPGEVICQMDDWRKG